MLGMSRVILPGEDGFQQGKMEALNKVVNVDYSQTICVASYKTELTHSRKFVKHKHCVSFPDSFPLHLSCLSTYYRCGVTVFTQNCWKSMLLVLKRANFFAQEYFFA